MADNNSNKNKLQADAPERNLENRGLRTKVPKPNILRIEVLDGAARERYLGTIQKFLDKSIKQSVYDRFVPASESVFYGFLKNTGTQGVNITANWNNNGGTGGMLGDIKGLINTAASGSGPIGRISSIADKAIEAGKKLDDAAKSLGGFDSNLTGSSSLKRLDSVEMSDFEVSCGWYLPEQLNLAIASLRILTRMIYPRQVADEVFQQFTGDVAAAAVQQGQELFNQYPEIAIGTAVVGATSALAAPVETTATLVTAGALVGTALTIGDDASNSTYALNGALQKGAFTAGSGFGKLATSYNSLVGRNLTLDPLPVRVSIGHYMDLEPMVVTRLDIQFSKEQWIAPNGRHLPIFCDVTIGFKAWLSPAPKVEFMQLLGAEMFGLDPHQKAVVANIEANNKKLLAESEAAEQRRQQNKSTAKNPNFFGLVGPTDVQKKFDF